ncbi:hypothetical protein ACLM5J_03360 [Nocardioides sp. Bht2]|uniref:hypothetical protein n=1 Tax=Nocardioides sp. Bht2 TaxID=3392297 RepID=UPI0039B54CF7
MAKNRLVLHIGPTLDIDQVELEAHRTLLADAGLHLLDVAADDLEAASREMLRTHRAVGLERRDVEGSWAEITRHLWRGQQDVVVSMPTYADADLGQAALILDHLAGLETHVAITGTDATATEIAGRWARLLPARNLHQLALEDDAAAIDLAESLAGVGHLIRVPAVRPVSRLRPRRRVAPALTRVPA